jgi:PAS domain S-box-containing protein
MLQRDDDSIYISAAVVASSPDAIVAADMNGTIIGWNPAAEKMLGFAADEAIGSDLLSIMPEQQREAADRLMERVRNGEVVASREVTRMRQDGSTIIGRLTLAPIRDATGEIRGSVGIMHDITERKAIEELLQRNQRLASIGTLAAGIAHEVNNPVGGILMAAQYAGGALDHEDARAIVKKALADIEADAKRCAEIIRGLLRFARGGDRERSPSDLNEIIEAAVDLAHKSLPDHAARVEFERNQDEGLPAVEVDRTELRQALVNLITNGLQSGGSFVAVAVAEDAPSESVLITVTDDGAGVPEDVIDHLFDPFYTTKRQQGGTGLGLSLAHAIVTDHGGSLDVASSPSEGTTVTLALPLAGG